MKKTSRKKVNYESYKTTPLLIRSIKQAEKEYKQGKVKFFSNIKEMLESLNSN